MAIAQSLLFSMMEETPTMPSPPSSSVRPEIPFEGLISLIGSRISQFWLDEGHPPTYVVMSPEMWERFDLERRYRKMIHGDSLLSGRGVFPDGTIGMVVLDFGDEVICADKDEAHDK